jgi:rod shape-determining protein MreB
VADGIVDNVLPENAGMLFGEDALRKRLHLDLSWPLADGVIRDPGSARDFVAHVRSQVPTVNGEQCRAVIGVPANADHEARNAIREAVRGAFDRVLLIPEPFLAALGYRDDSRLGEAGYVDPVQNSLFVDIGAGTTDISLVQGYYPSADEQLSFAFAGDAVDQLLADAIRNSYPDCALSDIKVREIKETHSFVGDPDARIEVRVMVGGKPRKLDVTDQLRQACEALLDRMYDGVVEMIGRADADSVEELLQNIILTGGGSRIRQIAEQLQARLAAEGYENPRVQAVGPDYKAFVGRGALKAARRARENQWQQLLD